MSTTIIEALDYVGLPAEQGNRGRIFTPAPDGRILLTENDGTIKITLLDRHDCIAGEITLNGCMATPMHIASTLVTILETLEA